MAEFWMEVDLMFRRFSKRVARKVEEFTRRIAIERGHIFAELARRYGVHMALTVHIYNTNPVLTVPCLYVFVPRDMEEEKQQELVDKMYQEIAEWASDYRLIMMPKYLEIKDMVEPLIASY